MERVRVSRARVPGSRDRLLPQEPETHAFSLYHDYTETREGTDKYLNVVRARQHRVGSVGEDPRHRRGAQGRDAEGAGDHRRPRSTSARPCGPSPRSCVIRFPPVKKGQSVRLRIEETYTDPARYALIDGQLMWRRSFGRPRNDMVLPAGWYLTTSSIPATITQTEDGRVRLAFVNPRPDAIDVFVKGRRKIMLKGTRVALIKKIQPVSIHGQISLDVYSSIPKTPGPGEPRPPRRRSDAPSPRAWRPRRPALPGRRRDLDHEIVSVIARHLALALAPCLAFPLPLLHTGEAPQPLYRSQFRMSRILRPGLALPLAAILAIAPLAAQAPAAPGRGRAAGRAHHHRPAHQGDRRPGGDPGADLDARDRHRFAAGGGPQRQARGVSRQAEQVRAAHDAAGHRRHRGRLRRHRRLVDLAADRADAARRQAARAAEVRRRLLRGPEAADRYASITTVEKTTFEAARPTRFGW